MFPSPGGPHGGPSGAAIDFSNPAIPPSRRQAHQFFMSSSSATSQSDMSSSSFTPEMKDLQARGRDPYDSGEEANKINNFTDSEWERGVPSKMRRLAGSEKLDFFRAELRQKAIAFLDNPELLLMYAQSTGDSIPGARLHWTKVLCGFDDEAQAHRTTKPSTPRNQQPADNTKRRGGSDIHQSGNAPVS